MFDRSQLRLRRINGNFPSATYLYRENHSSQLRLRRINGNNRQTLLDLRVSGSQLRLRRINGNLVVVVARVLRTDVLSFG